MIYGLPTALQLSRFFSALGLGMVLSVLYYTVVFIREAVGNKKIFIVVQDVVFSVLASFIFFVFFEVYTYGEVRADLIISAAIGFAVSSFCFKTLFSPVYKKCVMGFHSFLKALFSPVILCVSLLKKVYLYGKRLFVIFQNKIKKVKNNHRIKKNKTDNTLKKILRKEKGKKRKKMKKMT